MTEPTQGAALLREAAAKMRAEARAADENLPWDHWNYETFTRMGIDGPEGSYFAAWHPAVAVAVAKWLEWTADVADEPGLRLPDDAYTSAETVARAYLGRTA